MFAESTWQRFPETHRILLQELKKIVEALESNSAEPYAFPFTLEPVAHFNAYLDFAIAVQIEKFKQLYQSVATSIDRESYLVYAQAGRAILESAATLRYYAQHDDFAQLIHAWRAGTLTDPVMRKAALTLDRFIRGSRFSWDAFVERRFDQLSKKPEQEQLAQVNVQTCLQKWYRDSPNVEALYDLMCDLVHPNVGSALLVVRAQAGKLVAGGRGGDNHALFVIAPTLAGIVGAYSHIQGALLLLNASKLTSSA